ncbi:MAG: hypothetical protein Q8N47_15730 [Bryobacterales bacterium]|nr:hypothetical protein [Bryobacterales bacterium]
MKPVECEFESEALAAALQSRWPEHVDPLLRAHVAACATCSDVIVVAGAIDAARQEMSKRVAVADSGRVWWMAQLRARREAAEAAGRPIAAVQAIAFACAVGLLGACLAAASTWFQSALGWIGSSVAGVDIEAWLPSASVLLAEHGALVLAMAAVIFLLPAAVYLAVGRD